MIHEGPRRKPLRDHDLVCPRRAGENNFFDPRRATKDHEENLCGIMIWSVHEGRGRTPFLSTKGHEGPRRKPLRDHDLVCPRRAGENTFFPRRATKDHGENLCGIINWSVHEGRGRTPFLTKGHEGPRRKPLRDHDLVCPRRAGENTFFGSTKGHEGPRRKPLRDHDLVCPRRAGENTFFVHEGPRRATKKTLSG